VLSLTLEHMSTAWVWDSETPVEYTVHAGWPVLVRAPPQPTSAPPQLVAPPLAPPPLPGGAGAGTRPFKPSPLAVHSESAPPGQAPPAPVSQEGYEAQMRAALDAALARAIRVTNESKLAGVTPSVLTGLTRPVSDFEGDEDAEHDADSHDPDSYHAGSCAPPPLAPLPAAEQKASEPAQPQPPPAAGAEISPTQAVVSSCLDAHSACADDRAAVILQSSVRGRLARQASAERRSFIEASEASLARAMGELEAESVAADAAASELQGAKAIVRIQSRQRARLAHRVTIERREFVAAMEEAASQALAAVERRMHESRVVAAQQANGGAPPVSLPAETSAVADDVARGLVPSSTWQRYTHDAAAPPDSPPVRSSALSSTPARSTAGEARGEASEGGTSLPVTPSLPPPGTPLPASALELLGELGLAKYARRFSKEDLVETSMFVAMLGVPEGATDLRAILKEVGMTVGHRERLLLALTTRPLPAPS
jgi:hypothetical protein